MLYCHSGTPSFYNRILLYSIDDTFYKVYNQLPERINNNIHIKECHEAVNIQLTRQAELKLKDKLGDKPGAIRLIYDTEGCGCAVNGVPSLRIVDEPTTEDIAVETGSTVPFIVNRKQAVFSKRR